MPASKHGDTPPKVTLNLDTLEREGGASEPFVVVIDGQRLTMMDSQDVEWKTLAKAEQNPTQFIRKILPKAEADAFYKADIPAWKITALMRAYRDHYGLLADEGE